MPSYQYRKSHCGDKTVVRSSYLHNGISYTGKMSSLYWIRAQGVIYTVDNMEMRSCVEFNLYKQILSCAIKPGYSGWYMCIQLTTRCIWYVNRLSNGVKCPIPRGAHVIWHEPKYKCCPYLILEKCNCQARYHIHIPACICEHHQHIGARRFWNFELILWHRNMRMFEIIRHLA